MLTQAFQMRSVRWIAGFVFLAFACEGNAGEGRTGITGATLSTLATQLGQSAGNDLANEIVTRIALSTDPKLKALVASDEGAKLLRGKCVEAVAALAAESTSPTYWVVKDPGTPLPKDSRIAIGAILPQEIDLNLGPDLKWKQTVEVRYYMKAYPVVDDLKPPINSNVWIQFHLPTLENLGGGDMEVGGGASIRTEFRE